MVGTLAGPFTKWTMFDVTRTYGTVQSLPYHEATDYVMAVGYNGQTGKGQQRQIIDAHVRKLESEMQEGAFTPTPVSAALAKSHLAKLTLDEKSETFEVEVDSNDPLLQTDGGHRFAAIGRVIKRLKERLEKGAGKDKEKLERWLAQAREVPITVTVYFDGNPAKDFVNLQAGRAVDRSHLLSMAIHAKMNDDPAVKLGFAAAKLLHTIPDSPFHNTIKFDSRGNLPLPVNTLCAKGGSDIASSLVGLARVSLECDDEGKDAAWMAEVVTSAYKALLEGDKVSHEDNNTGVMDEDMALTPIASGGTKGSSTMLVGVALCLAYRQIVLSHKTPSEQDLEKLVLAAYVTLDVKTAGNFSGPYKRGLLGKFAAEFFADVDGAKHEGVPIGLIKTLSASAFGLPPIPKSPKKRRTAAAAEVPSTEVTPTEEPESGEEAGIES